VRQAVDDQVVTAWLAQVERLDINAFDLELHGIPTDRDREVQFAQ
jgi:hypothetical protein